MDLTENKLISWGIFGAIRKEIIIDELIKNIEPPEKELLKIFINKIIKEIGITDKNHFKNWMKLNNFDEESWHIYIERKWKYREWCKVNFQDELTSDFFEKKKNFDKVIYSLLRVSDEDLANELYIQLNENESLFSELAAKYSEGLEKNNNGLIGPVLISNSNPIIANKLISLNKNEICKPFRIEKHFIIVRLEEYINAILNEEISEILLNEMGENYIIKKICK